MNARIQQLATAFPTLTGAAGVNPWDPNRLDDAHRQSLFPELMALDGHEGARRVIQAHPDETAGVAFPEGAFDIDTPEDYARLIAISGSAQTAPGASCHGSG